MVAMTPNCQASYIFDRRPGPRGSLRGSHRVEDLPTSSLRRVLSRTVIARREHFEEAAGLARADAARQDVGRDPLVPWAACADPCGRFPASRADPASSTEKTNGCQKSRIVFQWCRDYLIAYHRFLCRRLDAGDMRPISPLLSAVCSASAFTREGPRPRIRERLAGPGASMVALSAGDGLPRWYIDEFEQVAFFFFFLLFFFRCGRRLRQSPTDKLVLRAWL